MWFRFQIISLSVFSMYTFNVCSFIRNLKFELLSVSLQFRFYILFHICFRNKIQIRCFFYFRRYVFAYISLRYFCQFPYFCVSIYYRVWYLVKRTKCAWLVGTEPAIIYSIRTLRSSSAESSFLQFRSWLQNSQL